jgi:hypothetical protein
VTLEFLSVEKLLVLELSMVEAVLAPLGMAWVGDHQVVVGDTICRR